MAWNAPSEEWGKQKVGTSSALGFRAFEVGFADPRHPLFLLYPEYDPMSVIGGRVSIEPPAASGAGYVSACSSNHQLCVSAKTGRHCLDNR